MKQKTKLPPSPPCWICGDSRAEWDHIQTRGAGGSNKPTNLQPLCRKHHQERHFIGIASFVKKYNLPITFEFGYPRRSDLIIEETD